MSGGVPEIAESICITPIRPFSEFAGMYVKALTVNPGKDREQEKAMQYARYHLLRALFQGDMAKKGPVITIISITGAERGAKTDLLD